MNNIQKLYLAFSYVFVSNKPAHFKRLIGSVINSRFRGMNILRGIDFAVSYECNMRCKHCFAESLKKSPGYKKMSLLDYERVAKQAMALGCNYFGFQGGEILINPDYLEIIKIVQPQKNRIAITTNGLLADKAILSRLKRNYVDVINLSLDSIIPREHDEFRATKGSYDRVIKTITLAREFKLRVTINTTVSHDTLYSPGFRGLLEYTNKNRILINTLFAAPSGKWEGNEKVLLTEEDIAVYSELKKKYPFMVRDMDSGYRGAGCPAVKEVLYITPYGDVMGCPFIHICLGNVMKEPLDQIRQRGLTDRIFGYFHDYHPSCLITEDRKFIQYYLGLIKGKNDLPLEFSQIKQVY